MTENFILKNQLQVMDYIKRLTKGYDFILLSAIGLLCMASLSSLYEFGNTATEVSQYFDRQLLFVLLGIGVMVLFSFIDTRVLSRSKVVVLLFWVGILMLILIFPFGQVINGAKSWFRFGALSFQPSDLVKIFLIIVLAKYLSLRHIEIKRAKHLIITGIYFLIPFVLIFLQPDFGSSAILISIWVGMMLISGISLKQILGIISIALVGFLFLWFVVFKPYQKDRIQTFLNPTEDIRGSGYNVHQSMIAVGSGELLGKGVGYGTQSRLSFLPEHRTDFIFASFAEEWGFLGSSLIVLAFAVLMIRLVMFAISRSSNFEKLYAGGLIIYFISHILINIGMNIGLVPVTGITLPFMSYGGSHILVEFMSIGIIFAMSKNENSKKDRRSELDELVMVR